jgi:hypothetical protein
MSLSDFADNLIQDTPIEEDELQSVIDPELFFKYNSVNVLIGKRGSGKTHFVMKEVLKLSILQEKGISDSRDQRSQEFYDRPRFSQFYYSSDKAFDDTFEHLKQLIRPTIQIHKISHGDTCELITLLSKTKSLIEGLSAGIKDDDDDDEDFLNKALESEDLDRKPHTIILIDDCLNLFTSKRTELYKKLFENRQSRITFFLALQDPSGIPTSLKNNMDSLVLFGGVSRLKFTVLFNQIPFTQDRESVYDLYKRMGKNDYIILDFIDSSVTTSTGPQGQSSFTAFGPQDE